MRAGKPVVHVAGTCRDMTDSSDYLNTAFLLVMDGGLCHFDGEFDPQASRFTRLDFNGPSP